MFGWKRYNNDMLSLVKQTDLNNDQFFGKMNEHIIRLAKTNFIAGCLCTAAGAIIGTIGLEYAKQNKEKKNKELKDTDK